MGRSKPYEINAADIPLAEYNNIFVANLVWIQRGVHKDVATYDLVVREIPRHWGFYIFYGLERFTDLILNYRFDKEAVALLERMGLADTPETKKFYKDFRFAGDVYALKDGTIFFPGEPIVRITAPLAVANLLTAFLLNAFSYPVRILTKQVRYRLSLGGTLFMDGALARLSSFEQTAMSAEIAYLLNSPVVSPLIYRKRLIPVHKKISGNINHALIKSFPTEREAYRFALDKILPLADTMSVMVDTYDFKRGLGLFIDELKQTRGADQGKFYVQVDSGDLAGLTRHARKVLDRKGLHGVKIMVASNLDEYIVDDMRKRGVPGDCFIAATEVVNVTDNPRLEAVYKMAELRKRDGTIEYKAKLAKGKESYPGRKQVFRVYKRGKMVRDVIGLEGEHLGTPLLKPIIRRGKLVAKLPSMEETRRVVESELAALPARYKKITNPGRYPVAPSAKLEKLMTHVRKIHCEELG